MRHGLLISLVVCGALTGRTADQDLAVDCAQEESLNTNSVGDGIGPSIVEAVPLF